MTPPYGRPGLDVAFFTTLGVWAVGERLLTLRDFRLGVRLRNTQDRGSVLAVVAGVVGGLGAGFGLASLGLVPLPGAAAWLVGGLVVAWTGIALRVWAVLTLGRSFTTRVMVKSDQSVVTTGPYRLVRHPSYLGLLVFLLGLSLAMGDLLSVLVLIVLPVLGLLPRIAVEEAALRTKLGASYADYCRGRKRLIPGVW